jgi:uncharacterized protein (DUF1330 family)
VPAVPAEANSSALERFLAADAGRPFVLAQLLRFTEGGRDTYLRYSVAAQPIVRSVGAQVLYAGECVEPLVAAAGGAAWDAIVLVRYPDRAAYAQMLSDPGYQAIAHLRRSALQEAMLLPMNDWPGR